MVSGVVDGGLCFFFVLPERSLVLCYRVLLATSLGCSSTGFVGNRSSCRVLLVRLFTLLPVVTWSILFSAIILSVEKMEMRATASHA